MSDHTDVQQLEAEYEEAKRHAEEVRERFTPLIAGDEDRHPDLTADEARNEIAQAQRRADDAYERWNKALRGQ